MKYQRKTIHQIYLRGRVTVGRVIMSSVFKNNSLSNIVTPKIFSLLKIIIIFVTQLLIVISFLAFA